MTLPEAPGLRSAGVPRGQRNQQHLALTEHRTETNTTLGAPYTPHHMLSTAQWGGDVSTAPEVRRQSLRDISLPKVTLLEKAKLVLEGQALYLHIL